MSTRKSCYLDHNDLSFMASFIVILMMISNTSGGSELIPLGECFWIKFPILQTEFSAFERKSGTKD